MASTRVLNPACGSGNFLYVALAALLDLEKEVSRYGAANGLPFMLPRVGPAQLHGLEINPYARELAQVVVWIGYLQWMRDNGFQPEREPVLKPLETIELRDALINRQAPGRVAEAVWPAADVIIGNPPFLGGNRVRQELGDAYLADLFAVYDGRVPRFADLVVYFFEKARVEIARGPAKRAGLLATNSIRGGVNRRVLDRIKQTGDIFLAWSDEPWVLEGAAVRISIVGFDDGAETDRTIDGHRVVSINADLTGDVDVTTARPLRENTGIAFEGDKKGGPFELDPIVARRFLDMPINPNGRLNEEIVRPWASGHDVVRRPRGYWIIDFPRGMPREEAALFEAPFEYVVRHCREPRTKFNPAAHWWIHERPRPDMRQALSSLPRMIATVRHSKHRLFVWLTQPTLPDSALVVFARADDYFFGVLHSRAHEVWSLRMGTRLGVGNDPRYTPTTCFETFPFPRPTEAQRQEIAASAKVLDDRRRAWLDAARDDPAELRRRTLTNLYNQRPTWLVHAHAALDRAVWVAYGWDDADPATVDEDTILARLLALNLERIGGADRPMPDLPEWDRTVGDDDRVVATDRSQLAPRERIEDGSDGWAPSMEAGTEVADVGAEMA